MSANPYASPGPPDEAVVAAADPRRRALRAFHFAVAFLFGASLYNYQAFDAVAMANLPRDLAWSYRTFNFLGLLVAFALVASIAVPTLDAIARRLRRRFAPHSSEATWNALLERSLRRTPYLAAIGAAIWIAWTYAFYERHVHFQVLAWTVGPPAHLLAACFYVPLLYGWYRLSRTAPERPSAS